MPTTRKKVIKTVYKDEDSEPEKDGHDFSDSGSDAVITDHYSSDEECQGSSDDDFKSTKKSKARSQSTTKKINKTSFTKSFISKINKQQDTEENLDIAPVLFSVKDLTDADKLLPSVLNLSESDSSDDESPTVVTTKKTSPSVIPENPGNLEDDIGTESEYKDVWSQNVQDDSEEIAKKTFLELEQHKSKIEETKASIQNYSVKMNTQAECDVKDLLALGEEEIPQPSSSSPSKKRKKKVTKDDTDSEMEDWEEVKEVKAIPQQGLQLIVDIPNAACRKTKKVDVEMMMRRKINRVKKEYQVYMHKVHVLSWLGHGNYVSGVLNDQSILAAALSLVPSKECYPGERVDIKYITQITSWFKDKVTLKQDKHENKFRPKAPPLIDILQQQIKSRVFTTKKYIVFVYVSMLRSLGLKCRVMFNFVTVPIKPPSSELCSLTSKPNVKVEDKTKQTVKGKTKKEVSKKPLKTSKESIPQLDGNNDMSCSSDSDNIMQVDGSDDGLTNRTRSQRNCVSQNSKKHLNSNIETDLTENSVSPPKRARRNYKKDDKNKKQINAEISPPKLEQNVNTTTSTEQSQKSLKLKRPQTQNEQVNQKDQTIVDSVEQGRMSRRPRNTKNSVNTALSKSESHLKTKKNNDKVPKNPSVEIPQVVVTNESNENLNVSSTYFENVPSKPCLKTYGPSRKRSKTTETIPQNPKETNSDKRARTRSAQNSTESKYFVDNHTNKTRNNKKQVENHFEDSKRVSHRDLNKKINRKNDVTSDLIHIIKERVKEAKADTKKLIVKEKRYKDSDDDSDHLPVQSPKRKISESDDDFKPSKISPKPKLSSKKVDRRVLSTDDESLHNINKTDVWCEVFVEELEEWIAVDVIKGNVHCVNEIYNRASHPVTYAVGWDNNNYLKDLTRKYVPHWNTVTRKQRAEPPWWDAAVRPWLGPPSVRDREEDERLDRMQLEAPLPKSIAEYKNHPLYALKRHLLKFEAIYPPDAPALGFVRGEAVYSRDCVYVCRSRDTWLKEAKVVKLAQEPYKVVKARPKWDKLSNKLITDKPLEVFGPWQVKDYVPPVAVNGVVPRNAYGNVELFKECMLPGGTVHLKLPGLNRVAKKYNIDCAPAMTGFDFNGGWSHPVYDGFVVCKEFEEVITEAWLKDQEDQERREQEKIETRVYGNWRRLIRGLLIKEKLKAKYGFEEPSTSQEKKKKGPRLVVKKK